MDKQLTCATFATVIPVLALGGVFTRAYWIRATRRTFGYLFALTTALLAFLGEMAAILGTAWPTDDVPLALRVVAEAGAIYTTLAMTAVGVAGLTEAANYADRSEDETSEDS